MERSGNGNDAIAVIFTPELIVHCHNIQCCHLIHRQKNSVFPVTLLTEKDLELIHETESEDFAVRVGCVPFPSHATNIGHPGDNGENCGQFSRWHSNDYTEPPQDCMLDVLSHSH